MKSFEAGAIMGFLALAMFGCKRPPAPTAPRDPNEFLKWSMDRLADLPDLQCDVESMTSLDSKKTGEQARTFRYQAPNKFRVEAKGSEGSYIVAVSDGSQEKEYDNLKSPSSDLTSAAPANIAEDSTTDMRDPSLCGTPFYKFFGGSKNFDKLVKGNVSYVESSKLSDGEPVRIVKFNTPGLLGNVKAMIGERNGYVYALSYDLSGATGTVMKNLASKKLSSVASQADRLALEKILKTQYTEIYLNLRVGQPLSRGSFDPGLPGAAAVAAIDKTKQEDDSPMPLGGPAPDITVKTLDGRPISLSSLKGHPVMIDFWATWCGPCRIGLPDTAALQAEGEKSGLVVLAVSDENAGTIQYFLSKQSYRLTAYRDEGDAAQKAFQVGGLPSQVFIDPKGNLVRYLVGFHPISDVRAALRSAGAKLLR